VGIAMRTCNKSAIEHGTIQQLWQNFLAQDILFKIPHKANNSVMAVYYDYESDKNGEYTLLIGAQVTLIDTVVPHGLTSVVIPASKRAVLVSDLGPLSCIVFNLWQKIWNMEEQHQLQRAYTFDYELYDERTHNPGDVLMEIHISAK
jgi:predicted transcriptional regulator YdeE